MNSTRSSHKNVCSTGNNAVWHKSVYTGLFAEFALNGPEAADPRIHICSGQVGADSTRRATLAAGGAGLEPISAEQACIGEAIERMQPYRLPDDACVESSFREWPLKERAIDPRQWILFHPQQYAQNGFPFKPFTDQSVCRWICFRHAGSGEPVWVPEEMAYLFRPDSHTIAPAVSTGLSCSQTGAPISALLRGLQEVIERDAVVGGWWGGYPVEEWSAERVFRILETQTPGITEKLTRPNLRYRFYRVNAPFSSHVTMATSEGADVAGQVFSAGSACRQTRAASWHKSLLECIHGRYYVRYMLTQGGEPKLTPPLGDFGAHALYYSRHPERLKKTILHQAIAPTEDKSGDEIDETVSILSERLGPQRPVLFRIMTPPGIASEVREWHVLKVLVPGLQPLHGNDSFAHLGGPLWAPRGLKEWPEIPPHPFP